MSGLPLYPFDPERLIGTLSEVGPATAKVNLPHAATAEGQWLHGHHLGAGEVGEFVFIECADTAVFGRLIYIKLPERDRLTVEPELGRTAQAHPVGTIQLLTSVLVKDGRVLGGISTLPRLGGRVYSAHPSLIKWIAETMQKSVMTPDPIVLQVGSVPTASDTTLNITPDRLFGRHCAVVGATGGGKSWSVARLVQECAKHDCKIVLLDASGEFHTLQECTSHYQIGKGNPSPTGCKEAAIPYVQLTENDLFAMFRPSGQSQAPKLRLAMKSLKLAKVLGAHALVKNGCIPKAGILKSDYDTGYRQHAKAVESSVADFDITKLCEQIQHECVFPNGFLNRVTDPSRWGDLSTSDINFCVGLLGRIEDQLSSPELACIFTPGATPAFSEVFEDFIQAKDKRVLRVSLKHLPAAHDAREIVANAIGRYMLSEAKKGRFQSKPVVLFLDEAHQFLSRVLGDDANRFPLDSFELIAKEGRKFSLSICIATQRPRDIPEGVLSQMGTLVVHRLINEHDRTVVEKAAGDMDKSAAAFLPTLAPGEAIIVGADFPIPLTFQVTPPVRQPDSKGPDFQTHWRAAPLAKATPVPIPSKKAGT